MGRKVGVILSGCGVYDGSEIHEAVITLLALDRLGADIILMAPDRIQMHVIDHQTGEVIDGRLRNVRVESARIARGPVRDIARVKASELDALVIPGGFGAAKNLCDFAANGPDCEVDRDVARLILDVRRDGKPLVAICIAPALVTRVLTNNGFKPTVTIGNDEATAQALAQMGAVHKTATVEEYVFDKANNLYTTPAYMLGPSIRNVAVGIERTIQAMMENLHH